MEFEAPELRWGEFVDAREEQAFRLRHLDDARRQSMATIFLTTILAWLTVRNDFLFATDSSTTSVLIALRVVHTVLGIGVYVFASRASTTDPLFRGVTIWICATVILKFIVLATRPADFFGHVPGDIVFLLLAPLALPIPFKRQLGAMMGFAISDFLIALAFRRSVDQATATAHALTYAFAICVGTLTAFRLQTWMRREFHALRVETELRESLVRALAEVRTLRGIVPICSGCHGIRDDAGFWHTVEVYVRDHTHADFSHGLCPACVRRLYPSIADEVLAEGASENTGYD